MDRFRKGRAPCLIYPLERFKKNGFAVEGFFYNPNIHPLSEYENRKRAVENFSKLAEVEIQYPEYTPSEFFWTVDVNEAPPKRCFHCWRMRLEKTAQEAREKKFDYFSTTLLVSPYQDQEALKKIGHEIAKEEAIDFYYEDFRPGFRQAHNEAQVKGIYCQKYCGCIYSEIERWKESDER
ncbi:MAG: epoxyqueuosine reductase QueH [Candidatus Omnitrophica bacterium]|nr:epoxyqueuosine reductase QueH [Candidatus Omnitrophota bacterium]